MAEPVSAGTDVPAGTYPCTSCGYRWTWDRGLPLCPFCHSEYWHGCHPSQLVGDPEPTSPTAGEYLRR